MPAYRRDKDWSITAVSEGILVWRKMELWGKGAGERMGGKGRRRREGKKGMGIERDEKRKEME